MLTADPGATDMSDIRRILVHVNDSPRSAAVLGLAAALSRQHAAELRAVYAVEPAQPGAYLTPEASTIAAELTLEAEKARRSAAADLVAGAAGAAGADIPLEAADGEPVAAVLRRAHTADLLVLGQHDPRQYDGHGPGLAPRLMVGAGCPLLFVPYVDWGPDLAGAHATCGQRVLLAWSGKRESARALHDALPLLRRAQRVEVVTFAHVGTGDDAPTPGLLVPVVEHLRRHGVSAECSVHATREPSIGERMRRPWTPDAPVAEALLSYAADTQADLIVAGGYGHPRAWELALGGVTRTLLQSMTVPVLMSH
jgi:nucleotide-binding universal stress UspA family protein